MLLTPQLVKILKDIVRREPLADGEFRRVEKMGSYFLIAHFSTTPQPDARFQAADFGAAGSMKVRQVEDSGRAPCQAVFGAKRERKSYL